MTEVLEYLKENIKPLETFPSSSIYMMGLKKQSFSVGEDARTLGIGNQSAVAAPRSGEPVWGGEAPRQG